MKTSSITLLLLLALVQYQMNSSLEAGKWSPLEYNDKKSYEYLIDEDACTNCKNLSFAHRRLASKRCSSWKQRVSSTRSAPI